MRNTVLAVGSSLAAVIVACSAGEVASPSNDAPVAVEMNEGTTFHKDVEPILQKACQKCHVAGGIAPFTLLTYADAKAVAGAMVTQTKARIMPPWGAQNTSECTPPHPWKDDERLSDKDLATIEQWHLEGDREGDPKYAPKAVAQQTIGLLNPTILKPSAVFDPSTEAKSKDTMRCFVLDPQLDKTRYLNGTFFVPKNRTIVHHALAFAIAKGVQTPPEKAGQPSDTPYDCFGGPNAGERVSLLAAWAPGAVPAEYPPNVGTEIAAGTRIVMQIHYHPHANATPLPDQTEFHARFMDTPPEWIAITQLLGNFRGPRQTLLANVDLMQQPDETVGNVDFLIPPDAVGHTETMTVKFNAVLPELKIAGLAAHMHLAGRDEKVTLKKEGQPDTCLLQEPAWDFDWQRGYRYDVPIEQLPTVKGGDELQIRCKYDNVMANPKLGAALKEAGYTQPQPIKLGESTTEEMCLAGFVFLRKAAP